MLGYRVPAPNEALLISGRKQRTADAQFKIVFDAIRQLMAEPEPPPPPRMGFHAIRDSAETGTEPSKPTTSANHRSAEDVPLIDRSSTNGGGARRDCPSDETARPSRSRPGRQREERHGTLPRQLRRRMD